MITKHEIDTTIRRLETLLGPIRAYDTMHVAIARNDLRILIAAAKQARMDVEPYWPPKSLSDVGVSEP